MKLIPLIITATILAIVSVGLKSTRVTSYGNYPEYEEEIVESTTIKKPNELLINLVELERRRDVGELQLVSRFLNKDNSSQVDFVNNYYKNIQRSLSK